MNILISGGGTGGHIFPAIAIANALRKRVPGVDILFVGAENRMEMELVPAAGYPVVGLPVAGFDRKNLLRNISVLGKLIKSYRKAGDIIRSFRPDAVVGVGGYASGPILKAAQRMKIPTLIQEQNSYAGVTNKLLAKNADAICVAYHGMDKFFSNPAIYLTGNPVREAVISPLTKKEAKEKLGFPADAPLVAVVGGSLGARTLNLSVADNIDMFEKNGINLLWQTGKSFAAEGRGIADGTRVRAEAFLPDMGAVFRAADLIVCRAGASTISELQLTGTPALLVPSPNVAEDHQRHNAEALVNEGAAAMLLDAECHDKFRQTVLDLLANPEKLESISANLLKMGAETAGADMKIVDHLLEIIPKNK